MLTDILHAFALNATHPAYDPDWQWPQRGERTPAAAGALIAGIHMIGHNGDGFCFDNEQPAHQVVLRPVRLAPSLVTNGEWLEFMADGGYATPTPVAVGRLRHGRGARLERAGLLAQHRRRLVRDDARRPAPRRTGDAGLPRQLLRSRRVCALGRQGFADRSGMGGRGRMRGALGDAFGMVWQWTRSAYTPYPGYRAAAGALGEYNGKFMVNQMVLRGSSLATPAGHSRPSYRNFFYPSARWQFTGLRLAAIRALSGPMNVQTALRAPRVDWGGGCFRRRCHRRPHREAETPAAEIFLRFVGSALFERITQLPEYYPTRCELGILRDNAPAIAALFPPGCALIEFGGGSSRKARILLGAAATVEAYVPVDISGDFLQQDAAQLRRDFPHLAVYPLVADFTQPFDLPPAIASLPRVGFFPGSTIGNFEPHAGGRILAPCRGHARRRFAAGDRRRSGQGPENSLSRLQRRRRRDREIQSQSVGAHQPRARRRFQSRRLRASRLLQCRAATASKCTWPAPGGRRSMSAAWRSSSAPAKPSTPRTATNIRSNSFQALARGSGWSPLKVLSDGLFCVHALRMTDDR